MSATLDPRRHEAARLAELNRLGAMQPGADRVLQELVDDAREVFGTEFCMVNLVTADAQFFKVWSGEMPPEISAVRQAPHERSMCRHVVEDERQFVVEDFLTTERFREQHLRMGPGIRFYAGTPLKTSEGHAIGCLCLVDSQPRGFDGRDEATLRAFAGAVVGRLEALGAASHERETKEPERQYRQNVFELANDAILIYGTETGLILDANRRACEMYGLPRERLVGQEVAELSLEPGVEKGYVRELLQRGAHRGYETVHRRADGAPMDVSVNSSVTEYGGQRAVLSIVRDVTGRKPTEESLARAQRIAHIGNWEYELGGHRARWSDEMYRIFGFEPLDLSPSYRTFIFFVHPDDKERVRRSIRDALDGNGPEDIEYRIVRPDGEVRFVYTQYEAADDEGGRPTKFVGTVQDITDRKRVEQKLEEAQERYRLLVEQIPAVAYIDRADVPDAASYTSPRIETLLGYTPEEWLGGRLWLERLHPEDRDWVLETDTRARAAEEPFCEEYRLISKDGRTVWVRDESELLRDEAGRPLLWQGILIDITERKRVEEELRQSEARFRTIFERSAMGISIADRDRRLLETNPAYQSMLGYSGQELLGKPIAEISHPEDVPEDDELNAALVSGDLGLYRREKRYVRKDGEVIWVRPTISVVRDADGEPQFLVGMVEDITERKEREERLRDAEEKYRMLVEQTPAVTYIEALDKETPGHDTLYISPQVEGLLGYSPEEWTSDAGLFERLLHPEDRERVLAEDALTERTGEPFRMEYRLIARDARTVWVRDHAVQVKSEEGRPLYWQGVMYDVTERRQAEEALARSEERFRQLFENSIDAAFVIHPETREIVDCNSEACRSLGYTRQELLSLRLEDFAVEVLPEEERARRGPDTPWRRALSGEPGTVIGFHENVHRRKDGTTFPVEVGVGSIDWAGGRMVLASCRDAAARKEAEAALKESEERLQKLADAAFEGIVIHDGGEILAANKAYADMHGCEIEEIVGRSALEWAAPEYRDLVRQHILSGHEEPYESAEVKKDGTRIDVEVRGRALTYRGRAARVAAVRDVTERKRTEEALRRSEERFRALIQNAPDVIVVLDADGNILYDSPSIQRVLGYEPTERIGSKGLDYVHPEDLERAEQTFAEALGSPGSEVPVEYRLRHKDGSWRHFEATRTNLLDEPAVEGIVMNCRDVTERRRAEGALRRSEERHRLVVRATNEVIWDNDLVTGRQVWDGAVSAMFGYPPEELGAEGRWWQERIHPDDRSRVLSGLTALLGGEGEVWTEEYRFRRKDGSYATVVDRSYVVRDRDDRPVRMLGSMMDITERVRAEERLREAERRYRTLVERIPAVTYVQEASGTKAVTYVSPQMEEMLGYAPEECVSDPEHWIRVLHPDDRARVLAEDGRTNKTGEPFSVEYRQYAKDGRVVWIRDEAALVRDEGGEPLYWLGVQTDVTESRRTEAALRESEERHRRQARELELLHQVRTALAQELEMPDVFRAVVGAIARTYGYTQVSAYRLQGASLVLQHQVGYERVLHRIPVDSGIMGRVARTGEPVLLRDVRSDPEFLGAIEGITSEVCVPLLDEGEVVGTLNVESTSGVELTEADLRLMAALAEHVNVALSRSRLHARVRHSEERFRSLIQNSSDLITLLGEDGTVLYQSPSVEQMLGYRPEELVAKNVFDYIHPDDLDWAMAVFSEMLAEPESRPSAWYRFLHKDGSWRYVESIGSNLLDDPRVGELVINTRDITERKLWGEKLREAEERYRSLIETIPAITYVANLDEISTPIYLSPQYEAILGFTAEERVSTPDLWVRRLHPEDRERVLAANNSSNATGEPFDEEYRMVARDGRVVWLHDASVVLRDAEGHPTYRQGVMYDVTERRQTEEALQASEMRLRTVLEQSPLGVHIFAPDGTSLLTNEAWDELWYLDAEEAPQEGNVFEDDMLREAGLVRYVERSAKEGIPIVAPPLLFDPANIGREGHPRWLRTLIYAVKGEDGRVLETVLLLEDFTERKRAEDALEESEERYRAVIEQSAEAIWMFDPETKRVLETNAAFQEMLGYDAEELRAMTNYDFVAHSREDVDRAVEEKVRGEGNSRSERKYRMKNGTLLDVEVGGTVISYRGKEVVCSVARDITGRKRIEEEIRETNRRLSELATLRADFTAMVAHELDTPLAVIRGYADMLATGELGPTESERALSQIQAETEVLNALVEDVRIAASAERKDFAVVPRKVPVDELLDAAARFVVTLPGDHPLTLQHATDDARWDGVRAGYADPFIFGGTTSGTEVWADRYRIGQVLRNLLANAVKYSPEGTPIELRAVPDEAAGRVRIEVVDHGPGIHPDDMERIFEKFGRGRDPEGRKVSGLGLGLYLSRRILQAHGSDLKVNAAPDGGCVFSFELESGW